MPRALHSRPPTAGELRELLALETLTHDAVLAAIGGHFGAAVDPVDPLDEAARALFGLAGAACEQQAERLVELLFLDLALSPDGSSADGLILPAVIVTRRADPLVIAMIGHEIARRAGLESHVCLAGEYAWTALLDGHGCTLVGMSPPAGAGGDESGFHVACPHETATVLLERIAARGHGGARRCAGALTGAMRSGSSDVRPCAGHLRAR